jgi:hypothetical protein
MDPKAHVASSNTGSLELDEYLVNHFKSWEFPEHPDVPEVTHPVVLTRAGK